MSSIERRWHTTVLTFVVLLATLPFARVALAELALTETDRVLPEFELLSMEGDSWTPATLEGKLTIVNFWATWCPPCIEEMPSMNALWQKLEGKNVMMAAINAGEGEYAVADFLEKVPVDFPILLGDGATTLPDWSVRGLPTTLIVDGSGNVIYEALGPREWDDDAFVERVLSLR